MSRTCDFADPLAEPPMPTRDPPRAVTEAEWVPAAHWGSYDPGAYVVHVRWHQVTWTCVRPMARGFGNKDGTRLIVTPAFGHLGCDRHLLRRLPREEFLAVVDAAIDRELELAAADYAADCREATE